MELGLALIWLAALAGIALIPRERLKGVWLSCLAVLVLASLLGVAVPAFR